jgi:hypothetical protein
MALTDQEQRFVQDVMSFARTVLDVQDGIQKLADAVTALNAIDTALGDFTSGQAVNLIKVRG